MNNDSQTKNQRKSTRWTEDAVTRTVVLSPVNGVVQEPVQITGRSSMQVILDWITEPGNYSKYKGGSTAASGRSKTYYHGLIVEIMKKEGIFHRQVQNVCAQIGNLEKSFKMAVDWKNQTGQGIKDANEEDGVDAEVTAQTIKESVLARCPYFFLLEPVMGTRPSSVPPAPMCSGDNDVASIVELLGDVEENDNENEGVEDDDDAFVSSSLPASPAQSQPSSSVPAGVRRPLSAAPHSATQQERPTKKAKASLESSFAEMVKRSEDLAARKLELEFAKLEEDRRRNEREERRLAEEREDRLRERRRQDMKDLLLFSQLWKSMGKSDEEISELMKTFM